MSNSLSRLRRRLRRRRQHLLVNVVGVDANVDAWNSVNTHRFDVWCFCESSRPFDPAVELGTSISGVELPSPELRKVAHIPPTVSTQRRTRVCWLVLEPSTGAVRFSTLRNMLENHFLNCVILPIFPPTACGKEGTGTRPEYLVNRDDKKIEGPCEEKKSTKIKTQLLRGWGSTRTFDSGLKWAQSW